MSISADFCDMVVLTLTAQMFFIIFTTIRKMSVDGFCLVEKNSPILHQMKGIVGENYLNNLVFKIATKNVEKVIFCGFLLHLTPL